jgi:hypothetical protein
MICLIHTMIDTGMITELKCQRPECLFDYADFNFTFTNKANDRRGNPLGPCLDHIIPRHQGGLHRIENLRLAHIGCNAGWRKGITGSFHTAVSREAVRQRAIKQHASGRGPDFTDPERNRKISEALTGRGSEIAKRGWETRRRNAENRIL